MAEAYKTLATGGANVKGGFWSIWRGFWRCIRGDYRFVHPRIAKP